ncbi:hypothetical protein [Micromonospora sp. NBC_01796]|uniref:hypothetical protein n=1 Tax=Micromonospora sp. NBC_01796 TaxID=2975987 RepID=UPI002DDBC930|nr:hypothetical protein [Micromonospora sp. NBC_01796]WSA86282.1 hypothetical protein OIE47_01285 [Micromonospora sp. NBC_01796]
MEMPAAFVIALNDVEFEFNSARPDAPVVPYVERARRTRLVRTKVAEALVRAARVIEPTRPAPC